jgi:hypothetical protein
MSADPPIPAPPSASPIPPGPGASHDEWRSWRRAQRDYIRAQWAGRDWYRPWPMFWFGGWFWGVALVLIGVYYLLANLGLLRWLHGDILWPILIIIVGVSMLLRRSRGW